MSWGAQNRPEDAKTPSVAGVRSDKPELDRFIAGMYFDIKSVYVAIAAANVLSGLVVGWYTLWWLKKQV